VERDLTSIPNAVACLVSSSGSWTRCAPEIISSPMNMTTAGFRIGAPRRHKQNVTLYLLKSFL
jgi:hypothetical protein